MQLFVTDHGIARGAGEAELEIIDPEARDLAAHLTDDGLRLLTKRAPGRRVALTDVKFLPPIAAPGRFIIAGLNYRAHCEEMGRPVPDQLLFVSAEGGAARGAGAPILLPSEAPAHVDYEGEVAVVVGRPAANVVARDAWSVVAGLSPLNDVSARDVQSGGTIEAIGQAKGFPTFKPFGPSLATVDEFADPLDIRLRTWVNGELRQDGRTSDMVFPIPEIIEAVTAQIALEPGDVLCTGTPGGVAHGGAYPFLSPGDRIEIEVEGLPRLSNTVEAR